MIVLPIEAPRTLRLLAEAPPLAKPALAIRALEPEQPRRERLIGREREAALLSALVDHAPETGAALLIRGAPGAGKSALVGALVAELSDRPVALLRASGIRNEANLPYAGLHQLLRPVLAELVSLPRRQRRAIEAAFGIARSPAPDPLLIAIATLDLLSIAARPSLVVIVEDAQWLDRRTSEVLSFVARRLRSDRIVLLVTSRDDRRCPILDAGLAELRLEGLCDDEARRLLATVAPSIAEPVRKRLIDIAAGNPLALVELPLALTSAQMTGDAPLPDMIPLTARLERAVADRMRALPVVTRRLLRLLAREGRGEVADLLAADATMHPDVPAARDALLPAVTAGVVVVDQQIATFRDQLVRFAAHHGIDIAGRRSSHQAVVEVADEAGTTDLARLAEARLEARMGAQGDDPWLLAMSAAIGSSDAASIGDAAARGERPDAAPTDLLVAGMASAIAGDLVRSRLHLARAVPVLEGQDDRRAFTSLLVMQAWNDLHLGRWTEAASGLEAGARLARDTGQAMWSVIADIAGALLAAMRGDEDQVERALARVGRAAGGPGNGWVTSTVEVVRAINESSAGHPELAFDRLHERIASSPEARWAVDHFADAAVLSGRVEEARVILASVGDASVGWRGPLQAAALAYAEAVLADEASADERQAQAIAELAAWPVHQARLQLHRGAWLRRHRRVAESRLPLRAARDRFEALGAGPLAERARRELRASGERSRQRDVTAWDQLSPQETEIAGLAAQGLSNREIGEQLFLSHRTVGAHLYRIFPKLGVTSRGQLHTVLAALGDRSGSGAELTRSRALR